MSIMICPRCGKRAERGAVFCSGCGARLLSGGGAESEPVPETAVFDSLSAANDFLAANPCITMLRTNAVTAVKTGLMSGHTVLIRIELSFLRSAGEGGKVVFQVAEQEYVGPFAPENERLRQELERMNPRKTVVSLQVFSCMGGRTLAMIGGAGGIKHRLVHVTYARFADDTEPFAF